MHITKQKGFDEFTCIAEKCPESCCKCWQIFSDDISLEKYSRLAASDPRIKNAVDFNEGCFLQKDGICGFLDSDELCYLQKTYGEELLCDTCRSFPRHVEEFENVREYSLSLSCPHAAYELLQDDFPLTFEESDLDEEEFFDDFDCLLYGILQDARELLLEVAQNGTLSLWERLERISVFARNMQKNYDKGNLFDTENLIENQREEPSEKQRFIETIDRAAEKRSFSVLFELEMLHSDWLGKLDQTWKILFEDLSGNIDESSFFAFVKNHERAGEKILASLIYTYFCGAVYDGWIYSKAALAVYSVKWIFYIAFSLGGTEEVLIKTVYQYAREIEHSDLNLDALEEWFMKQV